MAGCICSMVAKNGDQNVLKPRTIIEKHSQPVVAFELNLMAACSQMLAAVLGSVEDKL